MSSTELNNICDGTCRICLNNNAIRNIFTVHKQKNVSSNLIPSNIIIQTLFSLQVTPNDGFPSKLCKKCYSKLLSAYKLKLLAEESFKTLLNYFTKKVDNVIDENKNDIKQENEIKSEIEDVLLVNSTIKDECLVNVLDLDECNDEIKQTIDSDYDLEDDTPLVFYAADDKSEQDFKIDDNGNNDKDKSIKVKLKKRKDIEKHALKKRLKIPKSLQPCGPSICDLCGKLVKNIKAHAEIHSLNRRKFPCGDCPKEFSTYGARRKHRNVHHLGNVYYCELCNKTYKRKYDHIRAKHQNRPLLFECMLCDMKFMEKSKLNFHMSAHTKERPFSCDICGKTFRTNASCKFHKRRVHDKEKSHMCQYCPKGFFAKHHLQIHLRTHTKEKLYKCSQCPKSFVARSTLSVHMKRHLGDKKYPCHICSRSFVCQGALRTHMISHTRERSHPCRYCGVKFGRTDHRNRHEKTAHKDKLNVTKLD